MNMVVAKLEANDEDGQYYTYYRQSNNRQDGSLHRWKCPGTCPIRSDISLAGLDLTASMQRTGVEQVSRLPSSSGIATAALAMELVAARAVKNVETFMFVK